MIIKIILLSVLLIAMIFAYYLTMRFNLHMFQLNGYKNGEHYHWLKKNIANQWPLVLVLVAGILAFCVNELVFAIAAILISILDIYFFNFYRTQKTKKKLVYTPRVKRMVVTCLILAAIDIVAIGFVFREAELSYIVEKVMGSVLILIALFGVGLPVVNMINSPIEKGINRYYINDAKKMLKSVKGIKVIGVTGSYGKTSVKFYLKTLLQDHFDVLVTPESYNTPMGVVKTIRGQLKSTHEIFVCEMGARHVGDIKEICDIVHPDHGVITSIGPQHLETFFNMENIKNTKFELANAVPESGMMFVNGDCEYINEKSPEYSNIIKYHAGDSTDLAGYRAENIKVSQLGTDFTVISPNGEKEEYQMHLIGSHNVINVVGAIAVANKLGIALSDLKIPVRRLAPAKHRMEMIERGAVTIIDDAYNSNPVGSKAAVETLKLFDGIRILITPGMVELGDKEEEYNRAFGTYAAKCCDYICLIGKKHTMPIKEGILAEGFSEDKLRVFEKLEDAMNYAYTVSGNGHKYILLENDLPDNY